VIAYINATLDDQAKQWQRFFGDDFAKAIVLPQPLEGDVIELEGHELRVIEVGQGDIAPSTGVHIPSIDTLVAGDVVYNRIHLMLALTGQRSGKRGSTASTGSLVSGPGRSSPGTSEPMPATAMWPRSSTEPAPTSATFATL
jgi:glyoxylase-like metal-dependent hydrolase (beta-lactamase superfamily II)